jgi:hypothetical protein
VYAHLFEQADHATVREALDTSYAAMTADGAIAR